jgi:uncharacterized protein with PIN domain
LSAGSRVFYLLIAVSALLILAGDARADQVRQLVDQLENHSDYKVRLSAALSLAKLNDQRSVPAFIRALRDSDRTVRGVAAASLGKVINRSTRPPIRKRALDELKRTAAQDDNAFVRKQAEKAYEALRQFDEAAATPSPQAGGVYLDLGGMASKAGDQRAMRELMRQSAQRSFQRAAPNFMLQWPGGRNPSKRDIDSRKMNAFHVDGTLTELTTERRGASTLVSCKVNMLLATYPDKSMFGFLNGGARVQAGSSERDVKLAVEDCVNAVVEDLVSKRIIPTIRSRVGP